MLLLRELHIFGFYQTLLSHFPSRKGKSILTFESIKSLLITICQYNTVRITQTFTKEDMDWIRVKCVPNTSVLELTFLQTEAIRHFDDIDEAAKVIEKAIYTYENEKTPSY